MSDKQDNERRRRDRRKNPRRTGTHEDAGRGGSDQRPNPLEERVRQAWRQILDRRHDERRVGERRRTVVDFSSAGSSLKAER